MDTLHSRFHPGLPDGADGDPGAGTRRTEGSRWSFQIATLAHIPVRVHVTFLLLLAWIAMTDLTRGNGVQEMFSGLLLVIALFACVVLHELSHALVAKRFGVPTREITLLPIGGIARMERIPDRPSQELLVAVAGPLASAAIALVLLGIQALLGGPVGVRVLAQAGGPMLPKLIWINALLAAFNLLPAFPMDGGRVLRAALAMRLPRHRATAVAAGIGQLMAVLFGVIGLMYDPLLALIAVFVWLGARGEASVAQLKSALSGMSVGQAMITNFQMLAPHDALARGVALTLGSFQRDFPVVDGGRVVGILTQHDLVRGLAELGAQAEVERCMQTQFEIARENELLEVAFERLQSCRCRALIVMRDDRPVGMLTPDNVGEMLTFESATRQR